MSLNREKPGRAGVRRRRNLWRICVVGALILAALTYGVAQLPGVNYQGALTLLVASVMVVGLFAIIGLLAGALLHWLRSR